MPAISLDAEPLAPAATAEEAAARNRALLERVAAEGATWILRAFAEAMQALHPADRLPARGDFDPVEVPRLLPHLILVEVKRASPAEAPRFLVRVTGQSMRDAIKINLTGRHLEDFLPEIPSMRYPIADRIAVCRNRVAVYGLRRPRTRIAFDFARIEYLHMPLAGNGFDVDRVLSIYAYEGERTVTFER